LYLGYFDGACEPVNPGGVATYGYLLLSPGDKVALGMGLASEPSENSTANLAECVGLLRLLEHALSAGIRRIIVRGDNQVVIGLLRVHSVAPSDPLKPLYDRVLRLKSEFVSVDAQWVPRELNGYADALTHRAYVEYLDAHPEARRRFERHFAPPWLVSMLGPKSYRYMGEYEARRLIAREHKKTQSPVAQRTTQ
jgi:ribonuclease HI